MNTLDLSAAYLGGSAATALYFGATKLWPVEAPGPVSYLYDNITEAAEDGLDEFNLNSLISPSTVTNLQQIPTGLGGIVSMSFTTGGTFAIGNNKLNFIGSGTPRWATKIIWPDLTSVGNMGLSSESTLGGQGAGGITSVTVTASFANLTSVGARCFYYMPALQILHMPKLTTLPSTTTIVSAATGLGTSGSLTVNSAITGSANWVVNRNVFTGKGWSINYVNG